MIEEQKLENRESYAEFFAEKFLDKILIFKGYPECETFHTKNFCFENCSNKDKQNNINDMYKE